jgi:tetratricopeptide (TPR) repeat protein
LGFRLQRRVRIAPGITMNISKRGLGMSVGPRGAKVSIGPRGTRESVGIPGTGMRYEVRQDYKKGQAPQGASPPGRGQAPTPTPTQPPAATIGFLGKAFKAPFEKEFIEGAQCMFKGDHAGALSGFESASNLNPGCMDAALLAAIMCINTQDYQGAEARLEKVIASGAAEFPLVVKYLGQDSVQFELPVTEEVTALMHFDLRAAYLTLAEVYQHMGRLEDAMTTVKKSIGAGYRDQFVVLSLAELYNDLEMDDELIAIAQGVENTDNVNLAIMFYLGQAMMRKGYCDAAITVLKGALARRKDRSESLLMDVRYALAQAYEQSGKKAMARKQYEQLLAKDFDYRDVKERADILAPKPRGTGPEGA